MALSEQDKLWFKATLEEHFVAKEDCTQHRAECYRKDIAPLKEAISLNKLKIAVIAGVVGSIAGSWDKVLGLFK